MDAKQHDQLKERFMQDFERDPLFKMDDIHDISKDQLRERTMEKVAICVRFSKDQATQHVTVVS